MTPTPKRVPAGRDVNVQAIVTKIMDEWDDAVCAATNAETAIPVIDPFIAAEIRPLVAVVLAAKVLQQSFSEPDKARAAAGLFKLMAAALKVMEVSV